ncbi:hypothetical protein ERO13_A07G167600v2 [Gossypium hirsutum]|uniref:Uncharacterized protein n=3 Tax=Gossypium TaxID=3633 RepID=A0A5J5V567_GOSBA|nr:hypothetical protein ES319_A07G182400v1 [Gossypium barbadense]KAG4192638.1 hypothetical protein ERO13_A07G167600v2 [Gossypium hirsutum]TYH10700.1 hypothetical protein ES288_A07G198000v1 [Gossypium darwinii]
MGLKGFIEGGIASIVAGASTHPLDLIKVCMQLQGESLGSSLPSNTRRGLYHRSKCFDLASRFSALCWSHFYRCPYRPIRRCCRSFLRGLRHHAPPKVAF